MPRHQPLSLSLWAPCLRGEISVDAHAAQRRAAAPGASAWVSASAGTGKTKVLTDRLLGLMLEGSDPARILCLTFTRAAAAEIGDATYPARVREPPQRAARRLGDIAS